MFSLPWLALAPKVRPKGPCDAPSPSQSLAVSGFTLAHSLAHPGLLSAKPTLADSGSFWLSGTHSGLLRLTQTQSGSFRLSQADSDSLRLSCSLALSLTHSLARSLTHSLSHSLQEITLGCYAGFVVNVEASTS